MRKEDQLASKTCIMKSPRAKWHLVFIDCRELEEETHYFTIISEIHLPTLLTNKIVFISPGAVSPGGEELKGNWRAECISDNSQEFSHLNETSK